MATTNCFEIKPQQTLRNLVNKFLVKTNLRNLEGAVKKYVSETVCKESWIKQIGEATDEDAEKLDVALIECSRFPSAINMALMEAIDMNFTLLNGKCVNSKLTIAFDTTKLRKAFSIYASGAFRSSKPRKKFKQLETLIAGSEVPKRSGIDVGLMWEDKEGKPVAKGLLHTSLGDQSTRWISDPLLKDIQTLIKELNFRLDEMWEKLK
jgi:hypothetical protein